ncbi:hypothetical protein ACQPYV_12520 [Micromonospora saelicesensis]|uniref:hypothetical protein n=1 Tax=Micromonospora saelicesensis TaxID=285676 RepID=UPI003D90209D
MPDMSQLSRIKATRTGSAIAATGGLAVSGVVVGDVSVNSWAPVKSRYLSQVCQIAPQQLLDRERELKELETYCAADDLVPYLRLRAQAWAGKSALLAWFVLHPPPRVRIVSFFVTARSSAQSDRTAFADVVMEQLADLLGEPVPPYLTDATREGHLQGMMALAAEACRAHNERFVLVVDGLDEDLGVTTGADARSIAALLPRKPPAGMRVVVSSRPNPPLPDDVPDDHPLRDSASVRDLAKSVHAQVVRHDAQRELKRLQRGTKFEQDLLGLLVAAGGELSGPDIGELTGEPAQHVDDYFAAATGRTFEVRPGRWRPEAQVYVLGHEELRRQVIERFGTDTLDRYREHLHSWAAQYRREGWPPGTPEYLFSGYFQLLHQTGDVGRMVQCALDNIRHDRMLEVRGSDTSALVEIDGTLEYLYGQAEPDLCAMALLALYRGYIGSRDAEIAGEMCALWAVLGDPFRIELFASENARPSGYDPSPWMVWRPLLELGVSVAEAGAYDRAVQLATQIGHVGPRSRVQREAAIAMAEAAEWDRADALTRAIADPFQRTKALCSIAEVALRVGDAARARSLAVDAAAATVVVEPDWLELAQREVAAILARSGNLDGAVAMANSMARRALRDAALADVVREIADRGDPDQALAICRSIIDPVWLAPGLALAAMSASRQNIPGQGADWVDRSLEVAGSIADAEARAAALERVSVAFSAAGDYNRGEVVARSITERSCRNTALQEVAAAAVRAGRHDRAEALARTMGDAEAATVGRAVLEMARTGDVDRAESLAQSIDVSDERDKGLRFIAMKRAGNGQYDRAATVAFSIQGAHRQADALLCVATRLALSEDRRQLAALAERIEALARPALNPKNHAQILIRLATTLALAGDRDRALSLAEHAQTQLRRGSARPWHEQAMTTLSRLMSHTDSSRLYPSSATRADAMIRLIADSGTDRMSVSVTGRGWRYAAATLGRAADGSTDGVSAPSRTELTQNLLQAIICMGSQTSSILVPQDWQEQALRAVATLAALAGDHRRADILANLITEQAERDEAWRALAIAAAGAGDHDRAQATTDLIETPHRRIQALADVALTTLCLADSDHAMVLTQSIDDRGVRDQALGNLATAAALLGDQERAETTTRLISDENVRASCLATLAVVLGSHGSYDRAEDFARSIIPERGQAEALNTLAATLAITGNYHRAEKIARSIQDPRQQVRSLIEVADWAPLAVARRLLAEALFRGSTDWKMWKALTRVEPTATEAVRKKLSELAKATTAPPQSPP